MTVKQAKAAKIMVEKGRSVSAAMREAGYSPNTAVVPGKLTQSKGWKEAMLAYGLTPERLMTKLNKGLDAKKTITSLSGDIISREEDYAIQHKYLDTALKVAGAYSSGEGGSLHFHQHITGNRDKYQL
jgi:hypothetical protein